MINKMIDDALRLLAADSPLEAHQVLIEAKRQRVPTRDLDYTRAMCFVQMNRLGDAREACKEALRYFPDHQDAKKLLEQILAEEGPQRAITIGDDEFKKVLEAVRPYTMLSTERLYSLFTLAKRACEEGISGNFVECGVAAGGSSALLAYVISRYSKEPRYLFSFDTFEGMPTPGVHDVHQGIGAEETGWGSGTCAAPLTSLKEACEKLGVWEVVKPTKGLFQETLPSTADAIGRVAFLHLDADWYESTMTILDNLYHLISEGGLLQVDDYGHWQGCRLAIQEFEAKEGIKFDASIIDGSGVWFRKPTKFSMNPAVDRRTYSEFLECDSSRFGITPPMSLNDRFQIFSALKHLLPSAGSAPFGFVEVGAGTGSALLLIYLTLKRASIKVDGVAIEESHNPALMQIHQQIAAEVSLMSLSPGVAARELEARYRSHSNPPRFVLLDGNSDYEAACRGILDFYPLVADGGLLAVRNHLPGSGVAKACSEVLEAGYGSKPVDLPILFTDDLTQGVSTGIRVFRKSAPKSA